MSNSDSSSTTPSGTPANPTQKYYNLDSLYDHISSEYANGVFPREFVVDPSRTLKMHEANVYRHLYKYMLEKLGLPLQNNRCPLNSWFMSVLYCLDTVTDEMRQMYHNFTQEFPILRERIVNDYYRMVEIAYSEVFFRYDYKLVQTLCLEALDTWKVEFDELMKL